MTEAFLKHPDEEALERFILNRCDEAEWEEIDVHVFGCESCQERVVDLDETIANIRAGGALVVAQEAKKVARSERTWKSWFGLPIFSFAGAAAMAAVLFVGISTPRDVNLSAFRGTETAIVPEWRPLRLHLNARDLDPGPVTVQVVDERGIEIWKGSATIGADRVDVHVPAIYQAGDHFIRLIDAQGNPLREFAIQTKLLP